MVLLSGKLCRIRSKLGGKTGGEEYQAHYVRSFSECLVVRAVKERQKKSQKFVIECRSHTRYILYPVVFVPVEGQLW
jgi:hypothetical protein